MMRLFQEWTNKTKEISYSLWLVHTGDIIVAVAGDNCRRERDIVASVDEA